MGLGNLFNKDNQQATIPPAKSNAGVGASLGQAKVIFDSIADGLILMDDQQNIQLINPAGSVLCGWDQDEATGLSFDLVFQLVDSKNEPIQKNDNPIHQISITGKGFSSRDYGILSKDKQVIPIRLQVSPLNDENTKLRAVVVFNNISEEISEEKQRADFISTASHEMRTPVAAIEGYLALALNDKVATIDNRARGYLDKAHASTTHLGQLFQDLLTSAKAEDGRLTSHPTIIDMGDYLTKLSNDLHLVAEKKGLFMDFAAGSSQEINATSIQGKKVITPLFYVFADPDRLREVITNLFDNAVKYTPEGRITLGLTGNDQVVQCYVRDTGPGIPKEDIPHLFQKFYRVDNSSTRTIGGTGLGLFICQKIIELYSGRIWAESELGKGSTFYINLPRISNQKAKDLIAADAAKAETPKPVTAPAVS
jgi:two-component system sensor histidine kinase VicK